MKTTSHRLTQSATLDAYKSWLDKHQTQFNNVELSPYTEHGGGIRVLATKKIAAHTVLVAVPETLFVSLKNLQCDAIELLIDEKFASSQVLQLAIAAERARGASSNWSPYFATLPPAALTFLANAIAAALSFTCCR